MSEASATSKPQRPPPPTQRPAKQSSMKDKSLQKRLTLPKNSTPPHSIKSNETGSQETIKPANLPAASSTGTTPQHDGAATGSRSAAEHSFRTSVADVREMEHSLLQLLDDFHAGKLQAFGNEASFEKMDQVREQQERLARMHFEIDSEQEKLGLESDAARAKAKESMNTLVTRLKDLSTSLQNMQKD